MTSLRLGILSDLHRTTDLRRRDGFHNDYDFEGHLKRVERALAWFRHEAVEALVLCGDLTHSADTEAMRWVLSECSAGLDVPVIAVSGNHDVAQGEDLLAAGVEHLEDHTLALGDTCGELFSGLRVAGVHAAPTSGYVRSRLLAPPEVQDWGDEPVILISHLPILSRAEAVAARGLPHPGDLLDREQVDALLRDRSAPTIVLSGHLHVRDAHAAGPVLQLLHAAMIEPPFEAAVLDVHVDADGRVLATRRTHRTSDGQATFEPTLVGPVGSWHFADGFWAADDGTGAWQHWPSLSYPNARI